MFFGFGACLPIPSHQPWLPGRRYRARARNRFLGRDKSRVELVDVEPLRGTLTDAGDVPRPIFMLCSMGMGVH